ncbi:MAG TPA: malto-oligosyltrehalose trehalohydrolase [Gemmatirosa sp.]
MAWSLTLGARPTPDGVSFRVWAPAATRVEVVLYDDARESAYPLAPDGGGYFAGVVRDAAAGARYRYRLDGGEAYPDPASRAQPDGVHGASMVVDPDAFAWTDVAWRGVAADGLVVYELHVGTFTPEGTFDAAITHLDHVAALGATAVEVMPIASFSGERNWGYDGVDLYASAAPYGGPDAFKRFVDAAHARGLGVLLDAVYNHFGPDGNYLYALTGGRFFTDRHRTPWGDAVAYDGPDGASVRDFVVQNALYWAHEYHVDGLRLDATHAILDDSPVHVLAEIAARLHGLERPRLVIAEDERNERRLVLPPDQGGYGLDGVWADDFHHQVRRLAAGDSEGYFAAFGGTIDDVVATLERGWFYEGQPVTGAAGADDAATRTRGTPATGLPPRAFVHCLQNHDQVGNRALGDRLHTAIPLPVYRALSALLLLSPYTPLLWMGQEWAASTPFQYFTDHPPELGALVTAGRREEFAAFTAFRDPAVRELIPDPQADATFARSKLCWDEVDRPPHAGVLALYRELLALRRATPALQSRDRHGLAVASLGECTLALRRATPDGDAVLAVVHVGGTLRTALDANPATRAPDGRRWIRLLTTEERRFGGSGEEGSAAAGDVTALDLTVPQTVVMRAVAGV